MGARTHNAYVAALSAFSDWLVREGRMRGVPPQVAQCAMRHSDPKLTANVYTRRLAANPFTGVPKANEKADPRRQRRALTGEELVLLLDTARTRPLQDRLTKNRGALAKLTDATRRKLERIGYERALIYKTLVLTGLRRGELASLTVGSLSIDEPTPYVILEAADEKARRGAQIPLRDDLARDLANCGFR